MDVDIDIVIVFGNKALLNVRYIIVNVRKMLNNAISKIKQEKLNLRKRIKIDYNFVLVRNF